MTEPKPNSRAFRSPPETLEEAECAIADIDLILANINDDLRAAEENPRLRGGRMEYEAWRVRAEDARSVYEELAARFRYYRAVLRVPRSPHTTSTRHLDTRMMRDPITLEEAETAVAALEAALAAAVSVNTSVTERKDSTPGAMDAVERASVAARHYRERLPVARLTLARMRANGPGPAALLEAFAETLSPEVHALPAVRAALGMLRAAVSTREPASTPREAA